MTQMEDALAEEETTNYIWTSWFGSLVASARLGTQMEAVGSIRCVGTPGDMVH